MDMQMAQVLMTPVMFEQFKRWLERDLNSTVFRIPDSDEDLAAGIVTYGISPSTLDER